MGQPPPADQIVCLTKGLQILMTKKERRKKSFLWLIEPSSNSVFPLWTALMASVGFPCCWQFMFPSCFYVVYNIAFMHFNFLNFPVAWYAKLWKLSKRAITRLLKPPNDLKVFVSVLLLLKILAHLIENNVKTFCFNLVSPNGFKMIYYLSGNAALTAVTIGRVMAEFR